MSLEKLKRSHFLLIILSVLSSCITIFVFLSGQQSLNDSVNSINLLKIDDGDRNNVVTKEPTIPKSLLADSQRFVEIPEKNTLNQANEMFDDRNKHTIIEKIFYKKFLGNDIFTNCVNRMYGDSLEEVIHIKEGEFRGLLDEKWVIVNSKKAGYNYCVDLFYHKENQIILRFSQCLSDCSFIGDFVFVDGEEYFLLHEKHGSGGYAYYRLFKMRSNQLSLAYKSDHEIFGYYVHDPPDNVVFVSCEYLYSLREIGDTLVAYPIDKYKQACYIPNSLILTLDCQEEPVQAFYDNNILEFHKKSSWSYEASQEVAIRRDQVIMIDIKNVNCCIRSFYGKNMKITRTCKFFFVVTPQKVGRGKLFFRVAYRDYVVYFRIID